MGLGLRGAALGLAGAAAAVSGTEAAAGCAADSGAAGVPASDGGSAASFGGVSGAGTFAPAGLPRMSEVVAAATSRAGMTAPSSAGAGFLGEFGFLAFLRARIGLGLRDAQIADRGFGNRPHVRAQTAGGGGGAFARFVQLLLKLAGLLVQIAGAAFQFPLIGGGGGAEAHGPPLAAPLAQLKVGKIKEG